MKAIFLAIFLIPLISQAQDTCKLKNHTDPYTKLRVLSTGFIPLQGGSLNIDATKPEVDLLFSLNGVNKCFTDASTASIFFVGTKAKQTQRNNGTMNCEGLFHFIFRNQATPQVLLRKIASTRIEKIVFVGNGKTETTITLTPEQQQAVMTLTNCIITQAPSLLQQ